VTAFETELSEVVLSGYLQAVDYSHMAQKSVPVQELYT
jgi:hypothetical protein